jgi:hypothetical protein
MLIPVPLFCMTFIYNAVFSAQKGDIGLKMGMNFNDFLLILNT